MGTFRRKKLRDDGVRTSPECNKEGVHSLNEIPLLHGNFFYFIQIVLKVITKVHDFIYPLERSSIQLHTGLYLHLPPAENYTHCLDSIVVNTKFLPILSTYLQNFPESCYTEDNQSYVISITHSTKVMLAYLTANSFSF